MTPQLHATAAGSTVPPLPVQAVRFDAAGFTDRGRTRPANEDCFRVEPELGLLVIADGMGGHSGGQVASTLAVTSLVECLSQPVDGFAVDGEPWPFGFDARMSVAGNRLRTAFHLAQQQLVEASLRDADLAGMGTTLVAAQATGGRLTIAWAGDSRAYLADSNGFRQVTEDDSWFEMMRRDDPDADLEALRQHPLRNALTNVVGTTSRTDVRVVELDLTPGVVVALTTDGVHGSLQPRHIAHLLSSRPLPAHAAADLVAAAMGAGSTDNCTAVVARWQP